MQFFTMKQYSANAQDIWHYYGTFVFNPLHLPLIPGEKSYLLKATPDFFEILGKVSPVGLFYIPKRSSWANDWYLCYGTLKIF